MIAHAEYPMYTVLLLKFKIKYSFKRIFARSRSVIAFPNGNKIKRATTS